MPEMAKGQVGYIKQDEEFKNPIEEHTADSKWQYCNCRSCQRKRAYLDAMPGPKINYDKIRNKDEDY